MTPTLHTLTNLFNPWRTIRRLEAENRNLDAQAARLDSLLVTARAKNAHYERSRLHRCRAHGQQPPNAWGCPECVRELRQDLDNAQEQLATAREALQKLQDHELIDEYIAWFKREHGRDPMLNLEPVAIKFARHLLAPIRNGYQPCSDGRTPNPPPSEP